MLPRVFKSTRIWELSIFWLGAFLIHFTEVQDSSSVFPLEKAVGGGVMADKPYDLAVVGADTGGCIMAAHIAQNGVHPTTGEPLRIALLDLVPYFGRAPRPEYGEPERRKMFTNVTADFGRRYRTRRGVPPREARRIPLKPEDEVYTFNTAGIMERHFNRE